MPHLPWFFSMLHLQDKYNAQPDTTVRQEVSKKTMNPTLQYHPTRRTQAVKLACATIGTILLAFAFYKLFHLGNGSDSIITLPVSFTFAIEAHSYTGNSKGIARRKNVRFHSVAFLMFLLGFVLMIVAGDTVWKHGTKLGIIACFISAHVMISLAYFKQPYQQAGAAS